MLRILMVKGWRWVGEEWRGLLMVGLHMILLLWLVDQGRSGQLSDGQPSREGLMRMMCGS